MGIILSVLALILSLISIVLVYLLDQKTNRDINDAGATLYSNQVEYYNRLIKYQEEQRRQICAVIQTIQTSDDIKQTCLKEYDK